MDGDLRVIQTYIIYPFFKHFYVLYARSVTEIAKRLEEQKNRALTVCDIFIPSVEVLRMKLKDYCERLILKDPIGNARKTEELLWRKAFYDVVYAAKKLRKVMNQFRL